MDKYNGYAFEILAFLNIDLIKKEISRNGFRTLEYRFQNENAQIDMVIDYGKNKYSIVECKHYQQPLSIDSNFEQDLINKKCEFELFLNKHKKTFKQEVDIVIFTANGINPNSKGHLPYLNVSLKDLFNF